MIKNLTGGFGITVTGTTNSDPYISPGSAGAGMLRWNPNMNCMEVNDGNVWKQFTWSYPTIELSPDVQSTIRWAQEQQRKDAERRKRVDANPALQKAYEAIKRAESNFDILDKLVGEECQICSITS